MDFKDIHIETKWTPPTPDDIQVRTDAWKQMMRQRVVGFTATLDCTPAFAREIQALIEQRAWTEAAEKEIEALKFIAEMWQVIKAVAEMPADGSEGVVAQARSLLERGK